MLTCLHVKLLDTFLLDIYEQKYIFELYPIELAFTFKTTMSLWIIIEPCSETSELLATDE